MTCTLQGDNHDDFIKNDKVEEYTREQLENLAGDLAGNLTCSVCGEKYTDGWEHALSKSENSPFLGPKDEAHALYMKRVQESGYKLPCFCGSKISWYGSGENYEVTCQECGFLWDED